MTVIMRSQAPSCSAKRRSCRSGQPRVTFADPSTETYRLL